MDEHEKKIELNVILAVDRKRQTIKEVKLTKNTEVQIRGSKWIVETYHDKESQDNGWEIDGLVVNFEHADDIQSNLWEIECEFGYEAAIKSEETGATMEGTYTTKFDYFSKEFDFNLISPELHDDIMTSNSTKESEFYDATVSIRMRVTRSNVQSFTRFVAWNFRVKNDGFSDFEFVFNKSCGKKLFVNREQLSLCSPRLGKLMEENSATGVCCLENIRMEHFEEFLNLLYPQSYISSMNANFVLDVFDICIMFDVPAGMRLYEDALPPYQFFCDKFKNFGQQNFSYMLFAEKYNLDWLNAMCFNFLSGSPFEVYRLNHHPRRFELLESTQERLVDMMRNLDLNGSVCVFCHGFEVEKGMGYVPLKDRIHESFHLPRELWHTSKNLFEH